MDEKYLCWISAVADIFDSKYGQEWAFTGSLAVYVLGKLSRITVREPLDIDILVGRDRVCSAWTVLAENGGVDGVPATPGGEHATISLSIKGEKVGIDILASHTRFSKSGERVIVDIRFAAGNRRIAFSSPISMMNAKHAVCNSELEGSLGHKKALEDLATFSELAYITFDDATPIIFPLLKGSDEKKSASIDDMPSLEL
jgi:hypothetical protein